VKLLLHNGKSLTSVINHLFHSSFLYVKVWPLLCA
jgi:hypothetical protein